MNFDNFNTNEFFENFCLSPAGSESSSNGRSPKYRTHINARERCRTQSVNMAFDTLRDLIPTEPKNRKLSKIEILRLANSYIKHLDAVVAAGNSNQPCSYVYRSSGDGNSTQQRSRICTFCVNSKNLN